MKSINYIIRFFACLMIFSNSSFAQVDEVEMQRTRSDFVFVKEASGAKKLQAKIFTKDGPNFYPIYNSPVNFYLQLDSNDKLLATVNTDDKGIAKLYIKDGYKLDTISGGYYSYMFEFEGNDTCKAASDNIEVKNLNISYEYAQDSASKTIEVQLTDDFGNPAPMENLIVYVERMHSLLPVKDDFTDDEGKMTVDFPTDLPGDSTGKLNIVYKVMDSFDYGTVYAKDSKQWGLVVDYSTEISSRSLWGKNAPLWMLIAISIVLLGAWTHFFIAIYHLFKMRKAN